MGMYTEFFFRAAVDEYAWRLITKTVAQWTDESLAEPSWQAADEDPHEFWRSERTLSLFMGASAYTPVTTFIHEPEEYPLPGKPSYNIMILSSFKNYSNEVEKFLDWIKPHLMHSDGREVGKRYLGYSYYEEADEPTLHFV